MTQVWINSVLEAFSFTRRLLAWDSYECHIEDSANESLKAKKVDCVIVPGGCTKYIQVPDVSWNKPFKSSCTEKYDEGLGTIGIHEELESAPKKNDFTMDYRRLGGIANGYYQEILHMLCVVPSR